MCHKSTTHSKSVVVVNDCKFGEYEIVNSDGTVHCAAITDGRKVTAPNCPQGEKPFVQSDGSIVCKAVQAKRGPRQVPKSDNMIDDQVAIIECLPGSERVVREDGSVDCVVAREAGTTVFYYDDDGGQQVVYIYDDDDGVDAVFTPCLPGEEVVVIRGNIVCRKEKSAGTVVVLYDDDDAVLVSPTYRNPCPANKEVLIGNDGSVICREKAAGTTVVIHDDDDVNKVSHLYHPCGTGEKVLINDSTGSIVCQEIDDNQKSSRNAPKEIPDGPCVDDDTFEPPPVTGANGNLLYGADCSTNRLGCMLPMTCQYMGTCQWTCKT